MKLFLPLFFILSSNADELGQRLQQELDFITPKKEYEEVLVNDVLIEDTLSTSMAAPVRKDTVQTKKSSHKSLKFKDNTPSGHTFKAPRVRRR